MLNEMIGKIVRESYADVFSVADLTEYQNELSLFGGEIVKGYKYGICVGIVLPNSIVNGLENRENPNNASLYYFHAYNIINERLNIVSSIIASYLNSVGYETLPIPAAERTNIEEAIPTVSHKMIGALGGLGWIGKNCLLITEKFGPRIRLVSILTNAPLKITGTKIESKCGDCKICKENCPVGAINGIMFNAGENREIRFDFRKCQDYFEEMKKDVSKKHVCGICLYSCPYGRLNKKTSHNSQ